MNANDIEQWEVNKNTVRFQSRYEDFIAHFVIPVEGVPMEHDNKWVLSMFVYQSHRNGVPVKRPRSKQIPRFKQMGVFDTPEDCKDFIALISV